jgi:hypothetical protein
VKNILDLDDPFDAFHLPLSAQAFDEFHEFNHLLNKPDPLGSLMENTYSLVVGAAVSLQKRYTK